MYKRQAEDFALSNPNGVWSYGSKATISGSFGLLTTGQTVGTDNGLQLLLWHTGSAPAVYANTNNTAAITGGETYPAHSVWCYAGAVGSSRDFAVMRFTVPTNGSGAYHIASAVAPRLAAPPANDSDFHVARNGVELFGQFLGATESGGYTNTLVLAAGDTIDFLVGRGADGVLYGSGLRVDAVISLTTNVPPPPPPPVGVYDLATGSPTTNNPTGPWSYGWVPTLDGAFTLLNGPFQTSADNGAVVPFWASSFNQDPAVFKNTSSNTTTAGGAAFPPNTIWFTPGLNGRPENFGVIRFTPPAGASGNYEVRTAVAPIYAGAPQGDSDFHVVKNGVELFGQNLAPQDTASYTNLVSLSEGDTLDLAIGRGPDANSYGSGRRIAAAFWPWSRFPEVQYHLNRQGARRA